MIQITCLCDDWGKSAGDLKSTYDCFHATFLPAYWPTSVLSKKNSLLSNHYFSSSVHITAQQNTHVNAQRNRLYFCTKYMMVNASNSNISGLLIGAHSASLGQFHTAVDLGCWYLLNVSFNIYMQIYQLSRLSSRVIWVNSEDDDQDEKDKHVPIFPLSLARSIRQTWILTSSPDPTYLDDSL